MRGLGELPRAAQRLLLATLATAAVLCTVAVVVDTTAPAALTVGLIAIALLAGEMFRVVLPYRHSSGIRFTLSDAALMAALISAAPTEVLAGMAIGMLAAQAIDRATPVKLLFNFAQYLAAAAAAALVLSLLGASPGAGLDSQTLAALGAALLAFLAMNTILVAGIVAITANEPFGRTTWRMLPTNVLVILGNGALAVLGVVVWDSEPVVLPALAAPLALIYVSSRQRVAAQLDRERSEGFVATEHRLGEARSAPEVAEIVVASIESTLALEGAMWRNGMWLTPVPAGSRECEVDPAEQTPQHGRGSAFGPAIEDIPTLAIGFGSGVLVVWQGDLAPSSEVEPWLSRLAISARVHLERVEAVAALEQERATLRAVVDGTADGIFVLDDAERVAVWNPAMRRLSGVEQAVGRRADDVLGVGPWAKPGVHDVVRPAREEAEAHVWRVAVAALAGGPSVGRLRVAVVHDVTEERRVARMKDDMLSVVSHELRTPLTPIKAAAQLLSRRADRLDAAQRARLLDQIEQRADHLSRLVEDLILVAQLSSSTAARPRVVPTTADLVGVLEAEVAQARQTHADHELEFEAPATLVGSTDALRLRQVLGNLLDNACKFSPEGSTVLVRLTEREDDAVLEVTDEGRGIPPEERERVFERFERIEDPMRMTTSGAGLGLYIVRALVTALGGTVEVADDAGSGTTIRAHLPLLGISEAPVDRGTPILRSAPTEGPTEATGIVSGH